MSFPAIALLLLQSAQYAVQDRNEPVLLQRTEGPIVIDGKPDEPAWKEISPLPLISYEPVSGLPPSEPTEIRITYDDDYIYASIRAYDSDPEGIRANSLYRDRLSGDDVFHILLDTYNDNESAYAFTVMPTGAKRDALVSNDGQGSDALNPDFSTYWDVATNIDERGWFAEVRIPFSSIGFQDQDGRVEMGLYVQRGISRKNERITYPEVPASIPRAFFRPSLAQKVVFDDVYSRRPLHITPYLTGGFGQSYPLNEEGTGYSRTDRREFDLGLDVKYGISSNLNLDLTVNTDFAQVEADDQQVNLTRFNLFFPEKRQFFQERSGLFEFNTGSPDRLFHSRRIGLTQEGEQVRILGGARLTGRVGSWDIGMLNMQTGKYSGLPSENFGVLRLRRNVINPFSYTGVMGTSRLDLDGSYNIGYGVDGSVRLRGDDYLSWAWAQSIEDSESSIAFMDQSRIRLHLERRSRQGLAWESEIGHSGLHYNPGTGFVPRDDYQNARQVIGYGWMPDASSLLQQHEILFGGEMYRSASQGDLESIELGPSWSATTRPGDQMEIGVNWHHERISDPFPLLGRTSIPAGKYEFVRASTTYRVAMGRLFRPRITAEAGSFYNGRLWSFSFSPTWNISRHLELESGLQLNLVDLPWEERFAAHVGQLQIRTALNTHLSTNAFIQYNSAANIVTANVRFRYNFRDGRDFWIVFNEGLNTDRGRATPMLPRTNERTLLVKYTYTFHR